MGGSPRWVDIGQVARLVEPFIPSVLARMRLLRRVKCWMMRLVGMHLWVLWTAWWLSLLVSRRMYRVVIRLLTRSTWMVCGCRNSRWLTASRAW